MYEFLKQVPLFASMSDPDLDRICEMVTEIYLEPGEPLTEELLGAIARALREFMSFHGSESLRLEHSEPKALGPALRTRLE